MSAVYFLAGIIFGYLVFASEHRPLRVVKLIKKVVGPTEEEQTDEFLAVMRDAAKDDRRLKNYLPKKKRRQGPLAIEATPSVTVSNMDSIKTWMDEHGMHDRPRPGAATTLSRVVASSRRYRR